MQRPGHVARGGLQVLHAFGPAGRERTKDGTGLSSGSTRVLGLLIGATAQAEGKEYEREQNHPSQWTHLLPFSNSSMKAW